MVLVDKSVKVPKEQSELSDAVVQIIKSAKKHGKDGFQVGDVPSVVQEAYGKLVAGIQGLSEIPGEAKLAPGPTAVCAGVMAGEITAAILEPVS